MSEPIPQPQSFTSSGMIPVELYAGPRCGWPMMVPAETEFIRCTCPKLGTAVIYVPSDLTSRKGCRVFRMQPEIPF